MESLKKFDITINELNCLLLMYHNILSILSSPKVNKLVYKSAFDMKKAVLSYSQLAEKVNIDDYISIEGVS